MKVDVVSCLKKIECDLYRIQEDIAHGKMEDIDDRLQEQRIYLQAAIDYIRKEKR